MQTENQGTKTPLNNPLGDKTSGPPTIKASLPGATQSSSGSSIAVGPPNAIGEELFAELAAVVAEEDCQLLHVGRHGNALQLIIDHPEGVTIDLCGNVSRQAGALLDGLDYGSGRYLLEVSSPGLDREFYSLDDYTINLGKAIKVVHRTDGRKATLRGVLASFEAEEKVIEVYERETTSTHRIRLRDVQTTRLEVEV